MIARKHEGWVGVAQNWVAASWARVLDVGITFWFNFRLSWDPLMSRSHPWKKTWSGKLLSGSTPSPLWEG